MVTLAPPPEAVLQGGLLDRVEVETFGIITLIVVGLIIVSESVWTWLSDDKANRRTAKERRHPGNQVGVLYCDAGQLSSGQSTSGDRVGDVVRSTLAARIRDCVREEDTVGRIGNDKLWVVLRGVHNVEDVLAVGDKIRRCVTSPIHYHLHTIDPTLNIGATLALPGESVADATTRTDAALAGVDTRGRNWIRAV
jgi:diguanylate cyclase (GGDEF)-like protein